MGFFGKKDEPPALEVVPTQSSSSQSEDEEKGVAKDVETKIDPEIEKRVVRKLDWHIVTLLGFLYMLSFLDRTNIGNARIAGMEKDLKLKGQEYDWLLTIFYIAYIVFSFNGFMWRILKPHQWAAITVLAWGIISSCQAATTNWSSMMALRFLLGAAEAGYSPSIPFLLSFFYNRREIGFRIGLWGSMAPLASTFAGALAYGITSGHSKLAPWRLLFLVEGLPTIVAAALAYFFLPDSASTAKFLTPEERDVARLRTEKQHGKSEVDKTHGGFNLKEIGLTLLDPNQWFVCLMYFSVNVSFAAIPVFLPTIIHEMGFSSINAQGLSAPPYFTCIFVVLLTTYVADKTQQRGLMIAFLSLVGGAGYVMLAVCRSVPARYAGVFLAINGGFPAIANILPWVVNNQGSTSRRGMAVVVLNVVGQSGPLLGTRVFPSSDAPRFVKGQSVCAAFMFLNAALALANRTYMAWRNRKLDELYGKSGEVAVEDDGDENYGSNFRYVL